MKIQINKLMQDLISNDNIADIIDTSNDKNWFNDLYTNGVLEPINEDNVNYLYGNINVTKTKKENNFIPKKRIYFNSIRIDKFYLGDKSIHSFFIYGLIMGSTWLSTLKRDYPEDIFIAIIQYDKGDEEDNVPPGFFVKCLHKRDHTDAWQGKDINDFEVPYLLMES